MYWLKYVRPPVVVFIVQSVRSLSAHFGVECMLYRNILSCFVVCSAPDGVTRNFCRWCRMKMRPTPSSPPSFNGVTEIDKNVSIQYFRSELPFAPHRRSCGFSSITVGRSCWVLSSDKVVLAHVRTVRQITRGMLQWSTESIGIQWLTNYDLL